MSDNDNYMKIKNWIEARERLHIEENDMEYKEIQTQSLEQLLNTSIWIANPYKLIDFYKMTDVEDEVDFCKQVLIMRQLLPTDKISKNRLQTLYDVYREEAQRIDIKIYDKNDFRDLYRFVNIFELDQNWLVNDFNLKISNNAKEVIRIMSNDLVLNKYQQLVLCRDIFHGETAADLALSIPKGFCSLSDQERGKKIAEVRKLMKKERNPLSILCAIMIGKDSRYTTSDIRENDVTLENELIYRFLIASVNEQMENHDLYEDAYTVIQPSPFFLKKIAKDQRINRMSITFVLQNEYERDIARAHFLNSEFSGNVRKNFSFISMTEFKEKQVIDRCMNTKALIFGNRLSNARLCNVVRGFVKDISKATEILILGSDDQFGEILKTYSRDKACVSNAIIIPAGINNSGNPKKKVFFSINYNGQPETKMTNVYKGILSNEKGMKQMLTLPNNMVKMDLSTGVWTGETIRSIWDNVHKKNANIRKRSGEMTVRFSNEILIYFSVTESEKKVRVEASIHEPVVNTETGEIKKGKRLKGSCKRISNIGEEDIEEWLLNVYPFEKVLNKTIGQYGYIRDEIAEAYKIMYADADDIVRPECSIRTFWYIYMDEFNYLSDGEKDILKSMVMSSMGNLNLATLAVDEIADEMEDNFPDDDAKKIAAKLNILSNLLSLANKKGFCASNVIADEWRNERSQNKPFALVRKNFAKRSFSRKESIEIFNLIMTRLNNNQHEYIAVLIKLLTGLENNIVCALTWEDFEYVRSFGLWKLNIYRQVTNDGSSYINLENENEIRDYPVGTLLKNELLKMKAYAHKKYGDEYQKMHIVPTDETENYEKAFPPWKLAQMCKEIIGLIGIDDDILTVPMADGGTKDTNLSRFFGDIFRSNFVHYGYKVAQLNGDEMNYLIGNKAETTIGANYLSLLDNRMQLIMRNKMDRIPLYFAEISVNDEEVAIPLGMVKKTTIKAIGRNPLTCRFIIINPANTKNRISIQNKKGFCLLVHEGVRK